jgi:hypothetical protein
MAHWWDGAADERYWCEITDRKDIGADLKCPQTNEKGLEYWSYSLIRDIVAGDIVFHYSTVDRAFVAASVAGAPLESRPIVWVPHGTAGRGSEAAPRPGWWLPLYGCVRAGAPLTLQQLRNPADEAWLAEWTDRTRALGTPAAPFQSYPTGLRAAQGYLTKMPREFVERWPSLSQVAAALEPTQERLDLLQPLPGPVAPPTPALTFAPKSDAEYVAMVRAGQQRRTRRHERLVRQTGEYLARNGGKVATSLHPIDLYLGAPHDIIFEAKIVGERGPVFAVREAVGQLFEYSHFLNRRDAALCILLDEAPGDALVTYIESRLGMLVAWFADERLSCGPKTGERLAVVAGEN